ncbi:MAG TPA: N-acyl homoserine lactonase family protein [Leeuwenhoekiella sp.]|nr:N-acyl homoserine lactonase family protein [Leeuwenhoekiella sp.]
MRRGIYIAILGLLVLSSCKDSKKGFEEGYESAQNEAQEATEEKIENSPKLYAFNGGLIEANDKNLFAQGDTYKGETITLADAFYVIEHPNGILLWDTGLPENLVGEEAYTSPDGAFTISRQDSIVKQLASIGVNPEDVKYIAFSHIHFDHTGGANNFPEATWLVQQTAVDFINSDAIKGNSFYDPKSFEKLTNKQVLNGDFDVFDDGKVVIKYLPGHTAGHQGLFVSLAQTGPVILTGDTYHFRQNRENQVVPQINYSIPESEESISTFEDFVKQKNAKVLIQHDMEDFNMMPKAPQIIE